ncbi:MAG: four helix bundle protein [Verrucomicrobiales bacterium]|nr:four helix bundle protein [Verrucomicrobiales bacterium]
MSSDSLPYARSFRDLVVYQKQRQLSGEVFKASKSFPPEERFSLIDQLRRAARSIGAQIAESWAKRAYERHFVSKLTDADAEQMETQHWPVTARDDGYLPAAECQRLLGLCQEIGRMLGSMIERASSFCNSSSLHEDVTGYFSIEPPEARTSSTEY